MLKFFQDQGGPESEHSGHLHWPGTADGFPVRAPSGGVSPDLRQEEFENLPLALDYHSERFRLWVAPEKANHDAIMDKVVNGWYLLYKRVERDMPDQEYPIIWLEWVQIYGEIPAGKVPLSGARINAPNPPVQRPAPSPVVPAAIQPCHELDDSPLGWPQ